MNVFGKIKSSINERNRNKKYDYINIIKGKKSMLTNKRWKNKSSMESFENDDEIFEIDRFLFENVV